MTTTDRALDREAAGRASGIAARLGLPELDLAAASTALIVAPTVGLSAFLLFTVEPLVGRLALPAFGGSPGVWAAVLAFFQAVLLAGYLYGHLSVTRLGLRRGALLHVGLASVALASLAIAPTQLSALRDESVPPILDLLRLLTLTVGPPAFVLTATTPLLTAWYAALAGGSRDGAEDPYWLYALSNGGSFLALLAYPFLVEPLLGLTAQRAAWMAGFAALCLALTAGAVILRARLKPAAATLDLLDTGEGARAGSIDRSRRLRWLLLAAVPAGLLSAVTNEIATDLISAPMLWVGPLAIYLASFVVVFSARGRRVVPAAIALAPVAITLLWVPLGSAAAWPILPLLLLEYAGLAIVATALHGRLALDRPGVERSTEFYLVLAAGGVIGGAFVGIVAPVAFKGVWEYPILLVAGLIALAWGAAGPAAATTVRRRFDLRPFVGGAPARLVPYLGVSALLVLSLVLDHSIGAEAGVRWLLVGGLVLLVGARPGFLAAATALVLVLSTFVIPRAIVYQDRSFFGVSQVIRLPGSEQTRLMNGTTLHGTQWDDPARRMQPTMYYARSGPAGDIFSVLDGTGSNRSVGIVGLGAGALAAYERPDDRFTFYEIDPVVVRVATDPAYFTYLSDAPVPPAIVLGDARLSLGHATTASKDLLVLDAFSSDSIPVHLLTVEAFQTYARVLRSDGLLAVHVSNRYYDLAPAVAASARAVGLTAFVRSYVPTPEEAAAGASPAIWVVAARDPAQLTTCAGRGWVPVTQTVPPPTDDHPDLLRFLRLAS